MSDPSALLNHIISQTKQNIEFLIAQKHISQTDGQAILAKIPSADTSSILALSEQTQRLAVTPQSPSEPSPNPQNAVATRRAVPAPPRRTEQVRALWDWNMYGQVRPVPDLRSVLTIA